MNRPRVILFEETEYPVDGCNAYGQVQYICPKAVPRPAVMETDELTQVILDYLVKINYDKDIDYFAVTGGMLSCAICVAAIGNEFGQFNALLYDQRNRGYTSRRLG